MIYVYVTAYDIYYGSLPTNGREIDCPKIKRERGKHMT